jgi:hypothetical protein
MKHIEWHNPANQPPPKGYRLLIPEEVDARFNSQDCKAVRLYCEELDGWAGASPLITADFIRYSYAVPSDTPLPEGYALIDGQVWRLDGWTLHTPGNMMYVNSHIQAYTVVEVQYRNGTRCTAQKRQHHFGQLKSRDAEIIAWRIVGQQAPKRMTATEVEESWAKVQAAWNARVAEVINPVIGKAVEIIYRDLVEENQRLKSELADARAKLKASNEEFEHRMRRGQETIESMTKKLVELDSYVPKRIQHPDGTIYAWNCPEHLIPVQKLEL